MERDFKHHVCAVDFDGTLCELAYPAIGAPREDIIKYVKTLREQGWYLILWTNREHSLLFEALDWCIQQGLEFDAINMNIKERMEYYRNDPRKIGADLFIDDLAVNPDNLVGCHICNGDHTCENCYYAQEDDKDYNCNCDIGEGGDMLGWTPLGDKYCRNCGRKLK